MVEKKSESVVKRVAYALALAAALAVYGCSKGDRDAYSETPSGASAKAESASAGSNPYNSDMSRQQAPMHYAARNSTERAVVRQAGLTVQVENMDKAEKQMKEIVRDQGGYIATQAGDDLAGENPVMRVTIRVPERSFESMLTSFQALGRRTQMSIAATDVTEDILDTDAQIKSIKGAQETLKSNGKVPLTTGFDSTQDQLRALEAQKSQLATRAAMSTIDLVLQQKANLDLSTAAHSNWGTDTWSAAMTSSMGALRAVGGIMIWLLAYSPLWLAMICGVVFGRRAWRRYSGKAQAA